MKSLPGIFAAVEKEHSRSVEKHGSWKQLPDERQRIAIEEEVAEWQRAYDRGDINGDHGELTEALHAINTLCRRILYLEGSPDA
jgi:hypothetical protein